MTQRAFRAFALHDLRLEALAFRAFLLQEKPLARQVFQVFALRVRGALAPVHLVLSAFALAVFIQPMIVQLAFVLRHSLTFVPPRLARLVLASRANCRPG